MRVQVFEHGCGGHHTNYIEALLPRLIDLKHQGKIDQVIVTITRTHLDSDNFQQQLAPFVAEVDFRELEFPVKPKLPVLSGQAQLMQTILQAIEQVRPDYLVAPSADSQSLMLAITNLLGRKTLPKSVHSVGVFHAGYAGTVDNWQDYLKDQVYRFSWRYAPWSRMLLVNPVVYECILRENPILAKRTGLLPDPVPPLQPSDRSSARKLLNIPEEGRYIGFVGTMDHRKAIPELLQAFRAATSQPTDRLLLAGFIYPQHREVLEREFADLLQQQRIILLDRFLSVEEMQASFSAIDVAAVLQYSRPGLSCNLLKAITAHRPVLVDEYGYTGMLTRRFQLGQTCRVLEPDSVVQAIRASLDQSADYRISPAARRLIEFHHPTNFADTILKDLYTRLGIPTSNSFQSWEWVNEGVAEP